MKQEELLKSLIKELMALGTTHQEYQDNDTHFVVDSFTKGNTLTIKVELKRNKDKEEFENWLQGIDDDILSEVLEELEGLYNLNEMYKTSDYKKVIKTIKDKTREVANRRIKELQKFLN